jgi:hypothetical protein
MPGPGLPQPVAVNPVKLWDCSSIEGCQEATCCIGGVRPKPFMGVALQRLQAEEDEVEALLHFAHDLIRHPPSCLAARCRARFAPRCHSPPVRALHIASLEHGGAQTCRMLEQSVDRQ